MASGATPVALSTDSPLYNRIPNGGEIINGKSSGGATRPAF